MKQEEIEKIKAIIGEAAYNEEYGFIFNSKAVKLVRPFAYIYPSKEFDYKLLGQFIVDAINAKLASLDQTGIDLREVEKLVQEFIRTENSLRELRWVTTLGVETTAEAYRKAIGYTLSDLEQFKNDEG